MALNATQPVTPLPASPDAWRTTSQSNCRAARRGVDQTVPTWICALFCIADALPAVLPMGVPVELVAAPVVTPAAGGVRIRTCAVAAVPTSASAVIGMAALCSST
jgi:hypothetical protein